MRQQRQKNKDVSYLIHQDCIHYLTFTKREDHRSPNEKQKTRVSKGTVQEMSDVPISCFAQKRTHLYNLPETNIAPESRPSQMESSLPTINFLGRVISHAGWWFETGPWHLAQVSSEHKHTCFFATKLPPKVTITSPFFRWFFANYFQTMNMILKKKQSCLKREPLQTDMVIFTSCFKGFYSANEKNRCWWNKGPPPNFCWRWW